MRRQRRILAGTSHIDARPLLIALLLVTAVAGVYWECGHYEFINLDDPTYVYQNPHVRSGLTKDGLAWAFTTFYAGNWHPLTWISHMTDVEAFGLEPGWHHRVSVFLHGLNAVLLFFVLRMMTSAVWRSALVAALFAVHPLRVESVAWIAERKDVLSTFFLLLALLAYVFYVRRPAAARYLAVLAAFVLGLLSKPMLVTLPLLLLFLDYWPLGRIAAGSLTPRSVRGLLTEKLPLFVLSTFSCAFTYVAQLRGGAVSSTAVIPVATRAANALVSCLSYLGKFAYPVALAALYPHPGSRPGGIPTWEVVGSALVLAATSGICLWQWRSRPYLVVGWLWYLVTLLPVIGLVQVGVQGLADRYTYVPMIGIGIAGVWGIASLVQPSRFWRHATLLVAGIVLGTFVILARVQAGYWRDSFTLFGRTLEVTQDNWVAWSTLADAYYDAKRYPSAIGAFRESLRLMPNDARAWLNLAIAYGAVGQPTDSTECFREALRLSPNNPYVLYNLGAARVMQGQREAALEAYEHLRQADVELAQRLKKQIDAMHTKP